MSQFSDFDEFLRNKEEEETKHHSQYVQTVLQSRKELDPLLRDLFALFKEYFETILTPRKPLVMILKKQETAIHTIHQDHLNKPYYLYRINLNDQDMLLPAFEWTAIVNEGFFRSEEITKHDWHPYVAMQLDIAFFDTKDARANRYTGQLYIAVTIRIWGEITSGQQTMLPSGTQMETGSDYKLPFIQMRVSGKGLSEDQMKQQVTALLMLCTNNVLHHDENVWKVKT